jgi:hypothetical protein
MTFFNTFRVFGGLSVIAGAFPPLFIDVLHQSIAVPILLPQPVTVLSLVFRALSDEILIS